MLAFFPWLKLQQDVDIGNIKLVRFVRGRNRDTEQITCERILAPYVARNDKPIEESTLVLFKNRDIFQEFDDREIDFLFSFAEIVAFSGLSKREYFGLGHWQYCNRDDFSFVIQRFREDSDGISIVTRRRDGTRTNYITGSVFKERMPYHINYNTVRLDVPLIKGLLDIQEKRVDRWPLYSDAIFYFNHANTDSYQISEHQEVVMIISAFERILECSRGREDDLVESFLQVIVPKKDIIQSERVKNSKYQDSGKPLREIWLRDFFQLRGDYAHGKRLSKRPYIWKSHEHLLLGSYIFPLLVKCILAKDGFYQLTDEDISDIDVFERLAEANLFEKPDNQKSSVDWKWNRIRAQFKLNQIIEEAVSKYIVESNDKGS